MRCHRCGRKANLLISDPAVPRMSLCEFCMPNGGVKGETEAEPSGYRAGTLHKRGIERLMRGNVPRVTTTPRVGRAEVVDVE